MWMNQYEIEDHYRKFRTHPTIGPAVTLLYEYVGIINSCSDGWPYWSPASHAAEPLMLLIEAETKTNHYWRNRTDLQDIDAKAFKTARNRIRSFCERRCNGILPDSLKIVQLIPRQKTVDTTIVEKTECDQISLFG